MLGLILSLFSSFQKNELVPSNSLKVTSDISFFSPQYSSTLEFYHYKLAFIRSFLDSRFFTERHGTKCTFMEHLLDTAVGALTYTILTNFHSNLGRQVP